MTLLKYTLLVTLLTPVAVLAFFKPLKIVQPTRAGVECVESWLCIDDLNSLNKARSLYKAGFKQVQSKLSAFDSRPLFVFCTTPQCFSEFGFTSQAANSIGSLGVVVAPRGWKPHYIGHELIHQWQSQRFGALSTWLADDWLTEGMAYSLSDAPREVLNQPFEAYRSRYNEAYGKLRGDALISQFESDM